MYLYVLICTYMYLYVLIYTEIPLFGHEQAFYQGYSHDMYII